MAGPRLAVLALLLLLVTPSSSYTREPSEADRYREKFQCAQYDSGVIGQVKDFVSFSGDSMLIQTRNGKTIKLDSFSSEEGSSKDVLFCVRDYLPEQGILLVSADLYEDIRFTVVNLNTADVSYFDGNYVLSPDRKHLLHENIVQYNLKNVQIFSVTPLGLIHELMALADTALSSSIFSWKDNETIEMIYSNNLGRGIVIHLGTIRKKSDIGSWEILYSAKGSLLNKPTRAN